MADHSKTSDYNLHKLSTKDLEGHLVRTIECGGNVFVCGRRGSGKSVLSRSSITAAGCDEVYLNLSTLERPDIAGYPNFHAQGKKYVEYLMPWFFEKLMEGDKKVVLMLDETDKAETSLLAPLLEITQFRSINGINLKNLQSCIMTGNLQNEGGSRPSLPLLDRAEKYLLEANPKDWLDWAGKTGKIHPSITAYISDNPGDIFGDVDPGDIYADPSPRGWESSSKVLMFGEKNQWPTDLMSAKVAGYVGKKIGVKYRAYFEHYQEILPVVEKIMKGEKTEKWDTFEPSKKIVACMIACARSARLLDEAEEKGNKKGLPEQVITVGKFLSSTVEPEMVLISIRSQIGIQRVIKHQMDEDKYWDKILEDISKRISE